MENNWLASITAAFESMSGWELIAVVMALAYLLLAMKERIECWYAALVSTSIYIFLFWDVSLLMESALQIYYMLMAFYGWWYWRYGSTNLNENITIPIQKWPIRNHMFVFVLLSFLVVLSGYLLSENTDAAWPYIDSFTTWGSVITTYMVARKILENWLYWIVVDGVSIFLYVDRGLYLTALLFVLYVVIVIIGFFQWLELYRKQALSCTE